MAPDEAPDGNPAHDGVAWIGRRAFLNTREMPFQQEHRTRGHNFEVHIHG